MSLKNHPSRNNSIGKDRRKTDNQSLTCSVVGCAGKRSGYSKYCLTHKNHIANTGGLEQDYIKALKTTLKPYVYKIKLLLTQNHTTYQNELEHAKALLSNPQNINSIEVMNEFSDIGFGSLLSAKTINQLKTIKVTEYTFLAVVIAIYIFQKENPSKLKLGLPLFFHSGKLINSYTGYKKKLSLHNKIYSVRSNPSKNQYINLGIRLYSKFYSIIRDFIKQYEAEVAPSAVQQYQALRVRKTRIEELIEEKEDRVQFVKEQMKINSNITIEMANRQIIAIVKHMDALIEEEKRMMI